jgi:hypothetical protein
MNSLYQFQLDWLRAVHATCCNSHRNDFYVAQALFEAYVYNAGLAFEADVKDMAAVAGLTRRGVQKFFRRLEANGLCSTQVRYGRAAINTFKFTLPADMVVAA